MEEHSGSTKWKTKVYNEVRVVDQTVISLVILLGENIWNGIMIVISEKTDASANLIFLLSFKLLLYLLVIKQKCNIVVFRSSKKNLVNGGLSRIIIFGNQADS